MSKAHRRGARFTVIDVIRSLKIEPEKRFDWAVGQMVRSRYEAEYGEEPPKELRTKTCGVGVHCFAVYPPAFLPIAISIVQRHAGETAAAQAAQGALFDD